MTSLLLVPLDDTVVFPTMDVTLPVDVGDAERVLLIPRHGSEFAKVGTIAEVTDRVRLPGGGRAAQFLRAIAEPGQLADTSGYSPDLTFAQKVELLETLDVTERLELALRFQRDRLTELQVRKRIRDDVRSGAEQQQREYFLRKQMESIQKELGEDSASVVEEYRTKIAESGMPEAVAEQAGKELGRLERMGEQSAEASTIRSYLDWLISVPWKERSEERLDPVNARA